ncbi:MAG TPA: ABC transporter permease [Dehalococcoidia bacterium]|nr:ABC transporter permease [Dehalococcoidia bacterium]
MNTQPVAGDLMQVARGQDERRSALSRFLRDRRVPLTAVASILTGFLLWELVARFIVRDKLFLVAPSAIAVRFGQLWATGDLQTHIIASGYEFFLGMGIAAIVGIAAGLILATNAPLRAAFTPWVTAIYSTPTVALAPLLILWFGLGLVSHTIVVFLVAVFPVLVNTQTGIENADEHLTETARAFGASRQQIFTKILLPGAVPYIIAGLRLGIGRAVVGVVVAELFGAKAGLGFLITVSSQTFDMGGLFVAVLILAAAGVFSAEGIKLLERRIAPWRWA